MNILKFSKNWMAVHDFRKSWIDPGVLRLQYQGEETEDEWWDDERISEETNRKVCLILSPSPHTFSPYFMLQFYTLFMLRVFLGKLRPIPRHGESCYFYHCVMLFCSQFIRSSGWCSVYYWFCYLLFVLLFMINVDMFN